MATQITSTNEEKIPFTIQPLTAAGNPADIEAGSLLADVTSGDATVTINDDGVSGYFVSGSGGLSTLTLTADADLGEGVSTISVDVEYFVTAAQANNLGLGFGSPELK